MKAPSILAVDGQPIATSMQCPRCKSDRIRRSHSRPEDGPIRTALLVAYRCRACRNRFFGVGGRTIVIGSAVAMIGFAGLLGWGLIGLISSGSGTPATTHSASASGSALLRLVSLATGTGDSLTVQAERGEAQAQYQLGLNYRDGQLGARDPASAYAWLQRAADQGHTEAQYVLGTMHLIGQGALQSFPSAFEWFERAAQQNHAEAQFQLGKMYRRGNGVPVNLRKAYVWFNLAAAQGHELAGDARDNLLSSMTSDEVKAAQLESQEWRPVAAVRPSR